MQRVLSITAVLLWAAAAAVAAPGDLDPEFGGDDGVAFARFPRSAFASSAALDPLGRLVVASGGGARTEFARFLPDGTLDPAFAGDGKVRLSLSRSTVTDIAALLDGSIVAVGQNAGGWLVAKITEDGQIDRTFGTYGFATPTYGSGKPWSVAVDGDARLIVAGEHDGVAAIARYLPEGTPDASFSADGRRVVPLGSADARFPEDVLYGIAPMADGGVVATGDIDGGSIGVVRLDALGRLVTGFGDAGSIVEAFSNYDYGTSVLVSGDRIVVGAVSWNLMGMLAFTLDGTPDATFGGGDGIALVDLGDVSFGSTTIAAAPSGGIVGAGIVYGVTGDWQIAVARVDSSGALDGGVTRLSLPHANYVADVAVRADGRIVIGGTRASSSVSKFMALQLQG